jgi:hypothetical protein
MLFERGSVMVRDQVRSDAGQFEWVNDWAESARVGAAEAVAPEPVRAAAPKAPQRVAPSPVIAPIAHTLPDDQLKRDIAEIERARDALAAIPVGSFSSRLRNQALTLVPSRTADSVPIVVGGVLALVMLSVFGAAAAVSKFARQ